MRLVAVLGLFFYTFIFFLFGGFLIALAFDWLAVQDIYKILELIQLNWNSKIITGAVGFLLIIISISFAQLILGRIEKEKTLRG